MFHGQESIGTRQRTRTQSTSTGLAIQTRQGVRRLLPDDLAKGLGVPADGGT
jgi:hypothetical protein